MAKLMDLYADEAKRWSVDARLENSLLGVRHAAGRGAQKAAKLHNPGSEVSGTEPAMAMQMMTRVDAARNPFVSVPGGRRTSSFRL